MADAMKFKARKSNLKELDAAVLKDKGLPVPLPENEKDPATFGWMEQIRDFWEKKGYTVGKAAFDVYCDEAGLDKTSTIALRKQVMNLYKNATGSKSPTTTESPAKAGKKESKKMATKTAPAPAAKPGKNGKPVKSDKGNPAAKPGKNGKPAPAPVKAKAKIKAKAVRTESETVTLVEREVAGADVVVTENGGKYRVNIDGTPIRKVLQYLGFKGYTSDEARKIGGKFLKSWPKGTPYENGEDYIKNLLAEGHLGAHKSGTFGCPKKPEVTKAISKAIASLK